MCYNMHKNFVQKQKMSKTPEKTAPKTNKSVGFWHALNVKQPWMKVVMAVLLVGGVIWGVTAIWHSDMSRPAEMSIALPQKLPKATVANQLMKKGDPDDSEPTQPPLVAGKKLVALTFDDGPSVVQTPRLLQILREKKVKVTFFVVGTMARKAPEIVRQEEAEGHEVESHTMTHADLQRSTVEGIQWEVAAMKGLFTEILGHGPRLTRPPYGNINNNVRVYVNQPLILWTVDPEDWRHRNVTAVRHRVVHAVFDGAIVLLHDIHGTTVDAVAGIIDDLRAAGYEFVTVTELAAARGVIMQNGAAYGGFRP